ncbi:MAG TPA: YciI family protein, partial [Terriglobales bacterium]|nr:YciI family protein [Terriglobales bacterium]
QGPFAETKELVAGFWLWKVKSLEDAISWLKRAPFGGGIEVEIRPLFEPEDFGGDVAERERQQRQQLAEAKV